MTDHLIQLVGPGGAGKSTVGPALAKRLGVEYVDLDDQFKVMAGSISGYIDTCGYAARNVDLYGDLVRKIDRCAVFALSSGFMTYPLDIHSNYGRYRADIATSPMTFVLLPSLKLEICVAETVRRQMTRPFARTRMKEEAVIRERFRVYSDLTACKVETVRPVDQVCDDLVAALADRLAHGQRRTARKRSRARPARPVSPQSPLREMTQSDAVQVLTRMVEAIASGDARSCDQYVSEDYVDHQGRHGSPLRGPDGFRLVVHAANRSTKPEISIEDLIADETRAVARLRWRFVEAAEGSSTERETIEIVRIQNGRAVEHWGAEAWSRRIPRTPE